MITPLPLDITYKETSEEESVRETPRNYERESELLTKTPIHNSPKIFMPGETILGTSNKKYAINNVAVRKG